MILQLSDIQGWADTLNTDAQLILAKLQGFLETNQALVTENQQLTEQNQQQALEIEQLNNTLANLTIENATQILAPALNNVHNLTQ